MTGLFERVGYQERSYVATQLLASLIIYQLGGSFFANGAQAGPTRLATLSDDKALSSSFDAHCSSGMALRTPLTLANRTDQQPGGLFDTRELTDITWSNDGSLAAAYTNLGSEVNIWNARKGTLLGHYTGSAPLASSRSPIFLEGDKKLLATVANGAQGAASLSVVNVLTPLHQTTPNMANGERVGDMAADFLSYSRTTGRVAVVGGALGKKVVSVYDLNNRLVKLIAQVPQESGFGSAVAFSPDGKLLFVGSFAGEVRAYETQTWQVDRVIEAFPKSLSVSNEVKNAVASLAISPNGKFLLIGAGGVQMFRHRPADLRDGTLDPAIGSEPFVSSETKSAIRVYNLDDSHFLPFNLPAIQPIDRTAWISNDIVVFLDGKDRLRSFRISDSRRDLLLDEGPVSSFAFSNVTAKLVVTKKDQAISYDICDPG